MFFETIRVIEPIPSATTGTGLIWVGLLTFKVSNHLRFRFPCATQKRDPCKCTGQRGASDYGDRVCSRRERVSKHLSADMAGYAKYVANTRRDKSPCWSASVSFLYIRLSASMVHGSELCRQNKLGSTQFFSVCAAPIFVLCGTRRTSCFYRC